MTKTDRNWAEFAKKIIPGPHYLGNGYDYLQMMQMHGECYADGIVAFKRRIREVARNIQDPLTDEARMVCDDTYMTTWEPVPDVDSVDAWFKKEKFISRPCSAYDCTGKLFTVWWKFVKRNSCDNRLWLVHCVAIDW